MNIAAQAELEVQGQESDQAEVMALSAEQLQLIAGGECVVNNL